MSPSIPSPEALQSEIASLKIRLAEAEDALEAIQSGGVDALVINDQLYSLEGAEKHYRALVEHMCEGAAFINQDGIVIYANRYLADLLDTSLSDLADTRWLDHVSDADQPRLSDSLARPRPTQPPLEICLISRTGEPRPVLMTVAVLNLSGQQGLALIVTDIRARKAAETKIAQLNRLYAMASAVNAAIARQVVRTDLFQEFCRIAVELGGYRLAWIGLPDPVSGVVNSIAAAGVTDYLDELELSNPDITREGEPFTLAIREGRCHVFNDLQQADLPYPNPDTFHVFSLRAAASVPFNDPSALRGAFTVYGAEPGCFGDEEMALLQQMGSDLSFALEQAIQAERLRETERQLLIAAERQRSEAALREQARILSDTQRVAKIGSWVLDLDGHITWSIETYRLFGVPPGIFIPSEQALLSLIDPGDQAALRDWLIQCHANQHPAPLTVRRYLPDGSVRFLRGQGELQHDNQGRPRPDCRGTGRGKAERPVDAGVNDFLPKPMDLDQMVCKIWSYCPDGG